MQQLPFNPIAIPIAAVVALVWGFIWYNPKLFGNVWIREAGLTEEKMNKGKIPVIFIMSLLLAVLLALLLMQFTNHQFGALGMIGGDPALAKDSFNAFMGDYGSAFRSYKHGALHGAMFGFLGALPIIGINALFERKSAKYIFIHAGYWIITLASMGAILCGM